MPNGSTISNPTSPIVNHFSYTPVPTGGVAVLVPPRFSFGQTLANLINGWAEKLRLV